MKSSAAILVALLLAAPCYGQAVAIPRPTPDPHGNLREIGQLADPDASRVLKWNDGTNVIEWGVDATGGGGGGDVDAFAADPSSNGNFSAAAFRSDLGLVIGTNVQAYDADLTTWAGVTPSANGQSLVAAADYSAMRTLLSLAPGTNVQAFDADLSSLAGGISGIVKGAGNGSGFSAAVAGTDYLAPAAIGVTLQAFDADLSTWAGVTPSANGQSLVAAADYSAMRTLLSLVPGTNIQTYDADLLALAGLTSAADQAPYFTGSGTANLMTVTSAARGVLDDTTVSAMRDTLDLTIGADVQAFDGDLSPLASGITGLVKGAGNGGGYSAATSGTDYAVPAPITIYKQDGTQITRGVGLTGDALGDALESAFASDIASGDRVQLGPDTFSDISDDLLCPSNFEIVGCGPTTVLIMEGSRTDAITNIFSNSDVSSGNSGIRIAHMLLDMNNTENTDDTKKQSGVMFTKVDRFTLEGLTGQHAGRAGTDTCTGILMIGCTDGQIINNKFNDVVDGINTQASSDFCRRLLISGNVVESTNRDYGLTIYQCYDSVISNNVVSGCFKQGIEIIYSSNNVFANNFVKNCGKQTNVTYPGINISSVGAPANNLLIGNQVRNGTSGNLQTYGIVVNSSAANNVLIGNDFTDGGDSGAMSILSSSTVQLGNVTGNATLDASASRTALGATAGVWGGSLVAAATTSAQGASELAIASEVTTGSDATRAVTPDALRGSDAGKRIGQLVEVISDTALTVHEGKVFYRVPVEFNGWNLVGVAAAVDTVSSSGTPTFQVRRRRLTSATATSDADMLSTAITIDASEFDSKDAATAAVINGSNDDVQTGDRIFADCDTAGTGTKGMSITLVFQKP